MSVLTSSNINHTNCCEYIYMGLSIKNVIYEVFCSQYVLLKTHEAFFELTLNCYVSSGKYAWFLNKSKKRTKALN